MFCYKMPTTSLHLATINHSVVLSEDSDNEINDDLIGDKKKVFDFLNTSNMNELSLLSGCSAKKAEAIMALRPFKGWVDMVSPYQTVKLNKM